jgi:hypothetical protein
LIHLGAVPIISGTGREAPVSEDRSMAALVHGGLADDRIRPFKASSEKRTFPIVLASKMPPRLTRYRSANHVAGDRIRAYAIV